MGKNGKNKIKYPRPLVNSKNVLVIGYATARCEDMSHTILTGVSDESPIVCWSSGSQKIVGDKAPRR